MKGLYCGKSIADKQAEHQHQCMLEVRRRVILLLVFICIALFLFNVVLLALLISCHSNQ